jgi:hypothetical protein
MMDIDEAVEYLGAERVKAVLDAGAMDAPSAFAGHGREALGKALAYEALAGADPATVRLAATSEEELIAACQEGSETACDELDRRGVEPPLPEVDNTDLPMLHPLEAFRNIRAAACADRRLIAEERAAARTRRALDASRPIVAVGEPHPPGSGAEPEPSPCDPDTYDAALGEGRR